MLTRNRRRSAGITLVLLGTAAALAACGDSDDGTRRDLYASKQDCVQDWGDETKCESAPPGTTSSRPHSGGGYFYGPSYSSSSYRPGSSTSAGWSSPRSGSRAVATSSFSRGGFGHSGSSHGSSSS